MKVCTRFWTQIDEKSQRILLELDSMYIDKTEKVTKFEVE